MRRKLLEDQPPSGPADLLAMDTRAVNTVARAYAERYLNQDAVLRQFEADLRQLVDG